MQNQLGDEYQDFLASYHHPPDIGLRVNTLKLTADQFEAISPFPLTNIPWVPSGFLVPPDMRPGKHPYHAAGLYYLQDPSAMAVAELTAPQPGERVLDLAAAPGGKTTHMASLMAGEGLLVANDLHPRRSQVLAKNLERWGAHNVVVLNETPSRLVEKFGAYFDRVIVDAPCSGEGMFRKDPAARSEWMPKLVESCAVRQDAILSDAAKLVRQGGVLSYATCTFAPQENEGTIARFLDSHPAFELFDPPQFSGFSTGRPDWLNEVSSQSHNLQRTVRLWPHRTVGEGHFIALLQKSDKGQDKAVGQISDPPYDLPPESRDYFYQFLSETLHWRPNEDHLAQMGSHLYQMPAACPDLRGLKVVHWGWWLGTMKVKRFEPSHALSMGLTSQDFSNVFPLELDNPAVERYLKGEVLSSPGIDGWVLVTLDGFPMGWGKRVQGRLKTHLPKWLRQF
jgi:16S rRNA C967 or C1407 C5-methylase (RsmB/RsmF family)/NOL1/NOP2/fmu family ribosome biogenesis protein